MRWEIRGAKHWKSPKAVRDAPTRQRGSAAMKGAPSMKESAGGDLVSNPSLGSPQDVARLR